MIDVATGVATGQSHDRRHCWYLFDEFADDGVVEIVDTDPLNPLKQDIEIMN